MNTRLLALSALASLLAIPAAAENYYWSSTAPNPGNWFTPGNWRVGGDSEYDPVSEAVPVAGTDTVTFRQGTHGVTASSDISFGNVSVGQYQNDPANLTISLPAGVSFRAGNGGFVETKNGNLTITGGHLNFFDTDNNAHEFYSHGHFTASGADTAVSGLRMLAMWPSTTNLFVNGVTGRDAKVTLSPFDGNGTGFSLLVAGSGTVFDRLTVAGRHYESEIRIDDHAVVTNLVLEYPNDQKKFDTAPEYDRIVVSGGASVGNFQSTFPWNQPDGTSYEFEGGASVALDTWDGMTLHAPRGLLRVSGAGTFATNLTFKLAGDGARLAFDDGATVFSRHFIVGQGASGQTGVVSGTDTVWTILPKDMELEAVLNVGREEGGRSATNNTLVVENGARLHLSDVESYKGDRKVENLTGILVGVRGGDDGNAFVVRDGAVVTNDYWIGVGGTFNSSNDDSIGGDFNRFVVSNAVYVGGTGTQVSEWATTLFIGGLQGGSNVVEIVDGASAWFQGQVQLARGEGSGGNVLRVRNAELEIANRLCLSPAALAKGPCSLEISGTNGAVRMSSMVRENFTAGTTEPIHIRLGIPREGRSTSAPFLTLTSKFENFDNVFQTGQAVLDLDIESHWAQSGKDKSVVLVSNPVNWGNPGIGENAFRKLAESVPAAALGDCTLSVERDQPSDSWVLRCTAGMPKSTMLLIR